MTLVRVPILIFLTTLCLSPLSCGQFLKPSAREVHHGQSNSEEKVDVASTTLSEVKSYARKIWLAGLGAYTKVGQEGSEYFQELVKAGQSVEKKGKKVVTEQLEAANSQIDNVKSDVTSLRGKVEVQLDKVERAFDTRVASALNRIGIPSKHDVETLSAKLDELTALLERVARKH